jgi:hypothetical protein
MSKRILTTLLAFLAIGVSIFWSGVLAAETADVSATVTVQNISVTVTDGEVAYGTIATSGTKATTSSGVDDSQTVTNNGNVTEDFNITGFDVSTGCTWTLAATQGTDQYFHKFCNNGTCDSSPTWTALTTSYQQLADDVVASGTQEFDLQIGVPSSTSCYDEATVTVTVQATTAS